MSLPFVKYQGTGNDFILIDARSGIPTGMDVALLCNRHFGIGADGLMFLTTEPGYDFGMVYYNSDGNLSSMCGNGGRCIAHFAHSLGLGNQGHLQFLAVDGPHEAQVNNNQVTLQMKNVDVWEKADDKTIIINTGSPHYVSFINNAVQQDDLIAYAHSIRYSDTYKQVGINVNRVTVLPDDSLSMRTYERGVENETLSCGTGVTAAALSHHLLNGAVSPISVKTPGGNLTVTFKIIEHGFDNILLSGPVAKVFSGSI